MAEVEARVKEEVEGVEDGDQESDEGGDLGLDDSSISGQVHREFRCLDGVHAHGHRQGFRMLSSVLLVGTNARQADADREAPCARLSHTAGNILANERVRRQALHLSTLRGGRPRDFARGRGAEAGCL